MKILVIRFSSIGDIVLTTPVIRSLKTNLDAEVHYVTKEQYRSIVSNNPYLSKIHVLKNSLFELITVLKKEKFDIIVDLHNNLRTKIIKFQLRKKSYTFKKLNIRKWLMVNFKINTLPNLHIVDRYFKAISPLGVTLDNLGVDYFIPDNEEVEREWLPVTHQKEFVAFVVGAKFKTKQLPINKMIELCSRINKPIVLVGGKEDEEIGNQIEDFYKIASQEQRERLNQINKKTIIFNACGKFSINQSASIIKQSSVVFSHDTGMMHVAAAFQKEIYTIWGNTVPEFGMYPYRTKFRIFENKKIKCRPCSKIGFKKCPKKHFKCMNELIFDFYFPDS